MLIILMVLLLRVESFFWPFFFFFFSCLGHQLPAKSRRKAGSFLEVALLPAADVVVGEAAGLHRQRRRGVRR
jgi:hypothetical protein